MIKKIIIVLGILLLLIAGCNRNQSAYKGSYKNKVIVNFGDQLIGTIDPKNNKLVGKAVSGDAPESFLYKDNKLFVLNVGYGSGTPSRHSLTVFNASGKVDNYGLDGGVELVASNRSDKIYSSLTGGVIFSIDSKTQEITRFSNKGYFLLSFVNTKGKDFLVALDEKEENILFLKASNFKLYKRLALDSAKLKINYESDDKQVFQLDSKTAVLASGQKQTAVIIDLEKFKIKAYKKFPIAYLDEIFPADQPRFFVYKNKLYSIKGDYLYTIDAKGNMESVALPFKANNVMRSSGNRVVFANVATKGFSHLRQAYLYDLEAEKIISQFDVNIESDDFTLVDEKLYVSDKGVVHVLDFKTKKQSKIKVGGTPSAIYYTGR